MLKWVIVLVTNTYGNMLGCLVWWMEVGECQHVFCDVHSSAGVGGSAAIDGWLDRIDETLLSQLGAPDSNSSGSILAVLESFINIR